MVRILATTGQLATAGRTVRGARLFRSQDVEELAATRAGRIVAHHSVQFYESDDHLAGVVAAFLADGIRGGGGAIVIATESHRQDVLRCLSASGFAVHEALKSERLVLRDARAMLSTFLIGGEPDETLFREHVGSLIAQMRERWPRARLRVYGEMVDLLWRDGQRDAVIAVEEIWNRLAVTHSFSLLCTYGIRSFPSAGDTEPFDRICGAHTRVLPAESFHQDDDIQNRLREIARLQQRAYALECVLTGKNNR